MMWPSGARNENRQARPAPRGARTLKVVLVHVLELRWLYLLHGVQSPLTSIQGLSVQWYLSPCSSSGSTGSIRKCKTRRSSEYA